LQENRSGAPEKDAPLLVIQYQLRINFPALLNLILPTITITKIRYTFFSTKQIFSLLSTYWRYCTKHVISMTKPSKEVHIFYLHITNRGIRFKCQRPQKQSIYLRINYLKIQMNVIIIGRANKI